MSKIWYYGAEPHEYNFDVLNGAGGGGGSDSIVTDIFKSGTSSHKFVVATGATRYVTRNFTGETVLVFSGQFYMDSLPTTNAREILRAYYGSQTKLAAFTVSSTGVIQARFGTAGTPNTADSAAGAITTGQWYLLEWVADVGSATNTLAWKINSVDQTAPATVSGSTSFGDVGLGSRDTLASASYTFRWDDVVVADAAGDYPIGWVPINYDKVLPDFDIDAAGWSPTPVFSNVSDNSDATVVTATALPY